MKLEQTILDVANQRLLELESYAEENDISEDFFIRFSELTGLTELAHLADSGLSEDTITELINIEKKAFQLTVKKEEKSANSK
jgi:hypothetical protein